MGFFHADLESKSLTQRRRDTKAQSTGISDFHSSDCELYDSDTKVKINDLIYVYPEVSILCGKAIFVGKDEAMLTNPTLLVEVLSPSTEKYDRTTKADYYMGLPSVQAYLLLEQDSAFARFYMRDGESGGCVIIKV